MFVESEREYGVTIVGPVAEDPGWQAREATGFDRVTVCGGLGAPGGHLPGGQAEYLLAPDTYPAGGDVFEARFAHQDCHPCTFRARCPRAKIEPRSCRASGNKDQKRSGRANDKRPRNFSQQYAARSGIEGNPRAGDPTLWVAAVALHRSSQNDPISMPRLR